MTGLRPGGAGVAGRLHEGLAGKVHGALQVGAAAKLSARGLGPALRVGHDLERAGVAARAGREAHVAAVVVARLVDVERHERDHVRVVADHADARRRARTVVLLHEARDGGVERVGEVGRLGPPVVGEAREGPVRAHDEHDVMGRPALLAHGNCGGERGEPHHEAVLLVGERDVETGGPRLVGASVDGLVDPDAACLVGGVAAPAGVPAEDLLPSRGGVRVHDLGEPLGGGPARREAHSEREQGDKGDRGGAAAGDARHAGSILRGRGQIHLVYPYGPVSFTGLPASGVPATLGPTTYRGHGSIAATPT